MAQTTWGRSGGWKDSRGRWLFSKSQQSLLHGWTFLHTTSGRQVAGKQSRHRASPASALRPHTGSQLLSSTLGTPSTAHPCFPEPGSSLQPARSTNSSGENHSTEGSTSKQQDQASFTGCPAPASPREQISAAQLALEMPT